MVPIVVDLSISHGPWWEPRDMTVEELRFFCDRDPEHAVTVLMSDGSISEMACRQLRELLK